MDDTIFKYGDKVIWSLPLMFQYEPVYASIYRTLDSYGIRMPQSYLFGAPASVWTGGRPPSVFDKLDRSTLLRIFNFVYRQNAVPTITFTNSRLKKEQLDDKYANLLLDTALEVKARFIVYSDMLRDYIKSKDPNATVIASVNKANLHFCPTPVQVEKPTPESESNYYNKLLKEYDIVVVRPEYSRTVLQTNPEMIDDISRIEVLINQYCLNNCPRVNAHVNVLDGTNWLEPNKEQMEQPDFKCVKADRPRFMELEDYMGHTTEQVQKLVDAGVKHIKLQGRSNPISHDAMLLFMAVQMFNLDGKFCHILQSFVMSHTSRESVDIFNNMVFGMPMPQQQQLQPGLVQPDHPVQQGPMQPQGQVMQQPMQGQIMQQPMQGQPMTMNRPMVAPVTSQQMGRNQQLMSMNQPMPLGMGQPQPQQFQQGQPQPQQFQQMNQFNQNMPNQNNNQ